MGKKKTCHISLTQNVSILTKKCVNLSTKNVSIFHFFEFDTKMCKNFRFENLFRSNKTGILVEVLIFCSWVKCSRETLLYLS